MLISLAYPTLASEIFPLKLSAMPRFFELIFTWGKGKKGKGGSGKKDKKKTSAKDKKSKKKGGSKKKDIHQTYNRYYISIGIPWSAKCDDRISPNCVPNKSM